MRRGTTPTHTFTLPEEIPLSTFTVIFITYSQMGRVRVEKTIDDIIIDGHTVTVILTQADTLSFRSGSVEIQMRAKTALGEAYASDIVTVPAEKILKDGEI